MKTEPKKYGVVERGSDQIREVTKEELLDLVDKWNRQSMHRYGVELDPKYCDVIIKRWEDFTGKTAELIDQADG